MNDSVLPNIDEQSRARLDRLSSRNDITRGGAGYSRFVRLMRMFLPLAAALIGILVVIKLYSESDAIVPVSLQAQGGNAPEILKNELLNPVFESLDKKGNPYKITASRAVQGKENKDLIMLDRPVGHLVMKNNDTIDVTALSGAYQQERERFYLEGDVVIKGGEGYELTSQEAHVDLKKNFAWSELAVVGRNEDMQIIAKGLRVNGKTGLIYFKGPAKLILFDAGAGLE